MSQRVLEVEYYHCTVADKPGEARKMLEFLSEKQVNLMAFNAYPRTGGKSQLDFFPENPQALKQAASDAGIELTGPIKAFLLQGEDKIGALYDPLLKLSNAGVNITASTAIVDGTGRFGYIVWVSGTEYDKAAEALKSSDWRTIQTSPPK